MLTTLSSTDIVRACQILFSPEASCSLAFLNNLDTPTLKTAFRKKALETHPDRAQALGKHEADQEKRFLEVKMAYEALLPVAEKTVVYRYQTRPRKKPQYENTTHDAMPRKAKAKMASYYGGAIPNQRLRLGQYLYYSGIITWRHLIDAISWQRRMKPRYGQIALEWNIITLHDVVLILQEKDRQERFGEYARRRGYITGFQHLAIMGKQQMFHRPFGEYFVLHGILSQRQLDIIVKRAINHNLNNG